MKVTTRNLEMKAHNLISWKMLLLLIFSCIHCMLSSRSSHIETKQEYCPYFGNRAPKPQYDLRNCTWYKENSCCYNEEIAYAFSQLSPIPVADEKCTQHLNYLYCYICAPNQNTFLSKSTLTVCVSFCNRLYQACGSAFLKGERVKEKYQSGKEFCESRRFEVANDSSGGCFIFDPSNHNKISGAETSRRSCITFSAGLFALASIYYIF